jgi:hypothetical protein
VNEEALAQWGLSRPKQTNIEVSQTNPVNSATRNVQHKREQDGANNDRSSEDEYSEGAPNFPQIFRWVRGDAGLGVALLAE